ncbi:RebB family R body protein [Brevundimonas sp.]|jgi:hypothetical protein|uniref:RebB family R body protein n=1 Tax=Brevundimonas sp. TaxID=1871086 RepID=UPI001793BB71|nr:RebB family R body protein [Brevundimonas sp.]MBA4806083.1 RebB family R body protein [Brevundimonas sp.]
MAYPTAVNSQITDAVTQQNLMVLGAASTIAMGSIYQSAAHSTAIVFENAVQAQRQASICAQAATNQGVMQVYEVGGMVSAIATTRIAGRSAAPSSLETALVLLVALKLLNL